MMEVALAAEKAGTRSCRRRGKGARNNMSRKVMSANRVCGGVCTA